MKVMVTVCGRQITADGTDAPIEVITAGQYVFKNNKHYLIYEELVEGTDAITRNTLCFNEEECMMRRSGAVNVQMIFDKKNKTVSTYFTPYGSMVLGIDTKALHIHKKNESVTIEIDYALDLNYEFFARCSLKAEAVVRGSL